MKINIINRIPSVAEFNALRKLAGWPVMHESLVKTGLGNTLFSAVAEDENGDLVGMGRVVGDGAIYFHIADVIVHPNHQKSGVGRLIMEHLMKVLEPEGGPHTNIGLMCSKGREPFYKKFGFIERPNEKFGAGMILIKS